MTIVTFAPAARLGSHIIVTAYGVSGCGKTLSLLLLGRGLAGPNGKLGMIDTETGRGRIYANRVPGGYLYGELTPPFTPERYIEAIDDAEKAGVEVLIIDQASSEWEGIGGVLEMAETGKSRSGKPLEGLIKWARPKAAHKRYVQRLINSHMHLLIVLRAKEKMKQYTALDRPLPAGIEIGDIISEGFTPIQDKRFIFETTVQIFLPLGPRADLGKPVVEKCPEDLWSAFPEGKQISEKTGELIREWVAGGEPVDKELLALRRQAEEAAGGGVDAFRVHWRKLPKPDQARLTDRLDNLRSIAGSADAERPTPPVDNPFDSDPTLPVEVQNERGGERPPPEPASEPPAPEPPQEPERSRGRKPPSVIAAEPHGHGSPELDEDAAKLAAMGADPGPAIEDLATPASEPPAPERPQEPEPALPLSAPRATVRAADPADWSLWRQQFDRRMRKCGNKAELAELVAANFDHIADYNRALPRAAGIFAHERNERMEELPDG